MEPIKVLWIGDAVAATGFARVNHSIITHLVKSGDFEIHHLGINYFGDPHGYDWKIYPASAQMGDLWGFKRLTLMIQHLQPDVIFILNDIWVILDYFRFIPNDIPIVTYSPIDAGPLKFSWLHDLYERVTIVMVYTQFARNLMVSQYPLLKPVVVPHGIDLETFHPIENAREELEGVTDDWWMVLNANRNQPRKKIDSTLRGFAKFAKDKPENVKLYLHMGLQDAGWDLVALWTRLGLEERIVITNPNIGPQMPVTDERLNIIYNACDVGINTSLGEGWGLPSFEHAAANKIQLVPNSSACAEIFGDGRGLIIDVLDQPWTHTGAVTTDGLQVDENSVAEQLQWAYDHPEESQEIADRMLEYIQRPQFRWENIAKIFAKWLMVAAGKQRRIRL